MPRHTPRTIWKPVQTSLGQIADTTVPPAAFFVSLRSVDADASMGLQLKHLEIKSTIGLAIASITNAHSVSGILGLFKWGADAATPTAATVDLDNRGSIFARTIFVAQGSTPRTATLRAKSVRLKLGEELWWFLLKKNESDANILLHTNSASQHWETQA